MIGPNHKLRRSQTFRVEILESRALMSTAGLASRPAAAFAPLARPAVFASTAAAELGIDPNGSFHGKVEPHSTGISIKTTGDFGDIGHTAFHGAANYTKGATANAINFVNGKAILATENKHTDLTISFTGTGRVHDGDLLGFSLSGTVTGGKYKGKAVTTGTFSAHNTHIVARYNWTIEVTVIV